MRSGRHRHHHRRRRRPPAVATDRMRLFSSLALPLLSFSVAPAAHSAPSPPSPLASSFLARGDAQCQRYPWYRSAANPTPPPPSLPLPPRPTVIYQLPATGLGDQLAGLTTAAAAALLTNRSLTLSVPPTWGLVFEWPAPPPSVSCLPKLNT